MSTVTLARAKATVLVDIFSLLINAMLAVTPYFDVSSLRGNEISLTAGRNYLEKSTRTHSQRGRQSQLWLLAGVCVSRSIKIDSNVVDQPSFDRDSDSGGIPVADGTSIIYRRYQ